MLAQREANGNAQDGVRCGMRTNAPPKAKLVSECRT